VPADIQGPVTIAARLNYRKFDASYLRHIQGAHYTGNDLPITTMASDQVTVPLAGSQDDGAGEQPTVAAHERWNDYGIGLLREGDSGSSKGELRQAEQAFRQVELLGSGSGALNLARVYFKEGRLEDAAQALVRASAHADPAPPWTIAWFSARIDRENGHLDSAIATLESIVATQFSAARERGFDFSYDVQVLNELGRARYEHSRQLRGRQQDERLAELQRARDWFRRTLEIDPENLAAHYNLGQVYAQLGDDSLAEQHRALHDRYRPDDHAIEQAVARHRSANPAADHAAADIVIYDLGRSVRGTADTPGPLAGDTR
jgi:tetratricopeptide (TPR) repeat protein